jgi:5-methylcytosine-specific restriction enzyme A
LHKQEGLEGEPVSRILEQEFHEEVLAVFPKSKSATGYWPRRFLQKVRSAGGVSEAKDWLKPEKGLSPSLQRLARENRIDLGMEALVVREPWKQLSQMKI